MTEVKVLVALILGAIAGFLTGEIFAHPAHSLTWTMPEGATSCKIYVAVDGYKDYWFLAQTTSSAYTHAGMPLFEKYRYRVKCQNDRTDPPLVAFEWSNVVEFRHNATVVTDLGRE